MTEYTKICRNVGGSIVITIPNDIVTLYNIFEGDYITLEIVKVSKK